MSPTGYVVVGFGRSSSSNNKTLINLSLIYIPNVGALMVLFMGLLPG